MKPITFLFKTMQPAERNYKIYNKKLTTSNCGGFG